MTGSWTLCRHCREQIVPHGGTTGWRHLGAGVECQLRTRAEPAVTPERTERVLSWDRQHYSVRPADNHTPTCVCGALLHWQLMEWVCAAGGRLIWPRTGEPWPPVATAPDSTPTTQSPLAD